MRSPIIWFGGKGNMIPKLLPLIPRHRTYCEPCGGAASLLFAKQPSKVEVYNDIDNHLYNFFCVLRDETAFEAFRRKVEATPYSRQVFYECRETLDEGDKIERAWKFFVAVRQAFSGELGGSWSFDRTTSKRSMAGGCSLWLTAIECLPAVHARLMRVQIECDDFRTVIRNYDSPETFFYLDPPYVASTRKSGGYAHEMTDDDHKELITILESVQGKVLLSGYDSGIYEPLLSAGFHAKSWQTACHAAGRTRGTGILGAGAGVAMQARTETVWLNYEMQMTLF